MGFKIGLHSAGIYPRKLQKLLPLIDWIGLAIKARKNDYQLITRTRDSGNAAWQSAELVIGSGVSHQLRITAHPSWLAGWPTATHNGSENACWTWEPSRL